MTGKLNYLKNIFLNYFLFRNEVFNTVNIELIGQLKILLPHVHPGTRQPAE